MEEVIDSRCVNSKLDKNRESLEARLSREEDARSNKNQESPEPRLRR
jgi:hypothetical protein